MKKGCYTALATPFINGGVDWNGLNRLVDFQIESGITGILAVGTTGESPVLAWHDHEKVIEKTIQRIQRRCLCIAGTGSNNTREALAGSAHAAECGADAVLLVDPYYNGPSSLEIRREYVGPVAEAFPRVDVIPYIIPGRTGARMFPEDLALLHRDYPNVRTVKEATGDLDNMRRTRELCGPDFMILSGDDPLTATMMTDSEINAGGVISVLSNIAPAAVIKMVTSFQAGDVQAAERMHQALSPLFGLVTVKTVEKTPVGKVECRARNPLALKTLMTILGMPSGGCLPPLGKMTRNGLDVVLDAARKTHNENPEILAPLAEFFHVDIEERLSDPGCHEGLAYEIYYGSSQMN